MNLRCLVLTSTLTASLGPLLACGPAGPAGGGVVVRDSAGVSVVTNQVDPPSLPVWSLGPTTLDIGVVDGAEEYQLFQVRDAAVLPDGRIAVLNGGTSEIRFYGAGGEFITSVGRSGEGPGEYMGPSLVHPMPGDSLLVYDGGLGRFTMLDGNGAVGRTFVPEATRSNEPGVAGVIGDSVIVTHEMVYDIPESGFDTMYVNVHWVDLEGRSLASVQVPSRRIGRLEGGGMLRIGSPLFEPTTLFAAGNTGLWVGTARSAELRHYGMDGLARRVVRWPWTATPVTAADITTFIERGLPDSPDEWAQIRALYEDAPEVEAFPAYAEMHLDSTGGVWVLEVEKVDLLRTYSGLGTWLVLDPTGTLVARVELPPGLQILEIGRDYLLAASNDELDVEHVVMYDLITDETP